MEPQVEEVARRPHNYQVYIIACDFDGTITASNEFPRIGNLRPGIKELLLRLKAAGHDVIMTTCRQGTFLTQAVQFLEQEGIGSVFSGYNMQSRFAPPGLSGKVYAHFLLDDSATPGEFDVQAWVDYFERLDIIPHIKLKRGRKAQDRRK